MIGVVGRIVGAGGTVAEVPKDIILGIVDFGAESRFFLGAEGVDPARHHGFVVDGQGGAEVLGVGADHIGIAFGVAEAIHVGIEAIGAGQVMRVVGDFLSKEKVL